MENDLSGFDKHVMELFDLCKDILKLQEKRDLKVSNRKNPFLTRLEKYEKTYTKTEPAEHVGYFEKIYTDNKRFILLGPRRDSWLSDGQIVVSYGEDCGLKTDIKIHLSAIYTTACKMRDEITEESSGLPETENIGTDYPSTFIFLLYRIFSEIVTSDIENTKLTGHIDSIDVKDNKKDKGNDQLSGLFDMAANMAEQVSGTKIPRDKIPDQKDFGKMLGNMINDPKTKSMIGSVMQQFQGADGLGDIVTKLVGGLGAANGNGSGTGGGGNPNNNSNSSSTTTSANQIEGNVNDEFDNF